MPTPENPTQEPRAGELFNAEESSAIIQTMSAMPYASRATIPPFRDAGGRNRHNVTGEEVVTFLAALRDRLLAEGEQRQAVEDELAQLRRDVDAVRRLLFGAAE